MKISASEIEHIARLARLNLDEHEIARFQKDLDAILTYMDLLNEVDTGGIQPIVYARNMTAPLREDVLEPSQDLADALKNAPQHNGGSIVIPRILE